MLDVIFKFVLLIGGGIGAILARDMIPVDDTKIDMVNTAIGVIGGIGAKSAGLPAEVTILFLGYGAGAGVDLVAQQIG